jgi:hypothetical protein
MLCAKVLGTDGVLTFKLEEARLLNPQAEPRFPTALPA